jgi:hypothetical protein
MTRRLQFRVILVLAVIFVFVVLPALTWISIDHARHIERGGPGDDDSWFVWTLPTGSELRVHRLRSADFWKKWPVQVTEPAARYD